MSCYGTCDCDFHHDNSWEYECGKPRRRRSGRGHKYRAKDAWDAYSAW